MEGNPNETIPKANIQPIPAFNEPFSRIVGLTLCRSVTQELIKVQLFKVNDVVS